MSLTPTNDKCIENTIIGKNCKIWYFVNIYDSLIGDDVQIGSFCDIGDSKIGKETHISSSCFIPPKTEIGKKVFIGPGTIICNDKYPNLTTPQPKMGVFINDEVVIGANVTILPGLTIGKNAVIGAGAVVTKDVPEGEIWVGNPARRLK